MANNKKPSFPIAKALIDKMKEKKVREKAVEKLGDAAISGVGNALGKEAGRRATRKFRPGQP